MTLNRRNCLRTLVLCLLGSLSLPLAPLAHAQSAPQAQPAKPAPPQQKKNNPFEVVPQSAEPQLQVPQLEQPRVEPVKPVPSAQAVDQPPEDNIELIEFRGARRVPQDTLRALIFTKRGDKYDEETLRRDFMALWNTGRFDDIRLEREPGPTGWIVRFVVAERRVVRSIKYDGMKSITVSEILDRFKERKVGLQVESQYDPDKVQRAAVRC